MRPLAEHFGPDGRPKLAFDSEAEAGRYRRDHKGLGQKRIYECPTCGKFHLGRRRKRKR